MSEPSKSRVVTFVIIESPFAHEDAKTRARHAAYRNALMNDAFKRGEVPFASHGLYTLPGVLDDNKPEERRQGIQGGFDLAAALFAAACASGEGYCYGGLMGVEFRFKRVFGVDRGWSTGMVEGLKDAFAKKQNWEERRLGEEWTLDSDKHFFIGQSYEYDRLYDARPTPAVVEACEAVRS